MAESTSYAGVIALAGGVGLAGVLANRVTERVKVPAPLLMLAGAAAAAGLWRGFDRPGDVAVERIVTVALVLILFDGGTHIGLRRFRSAAAPIAMVGVIGTVLTTGACAALLHLAFDIGWFPSLLVATAVAPTDPAVVFSVLGNRRIAGRSATILEGESGANDPVGIALMASLIAAGSVSAPAFLHVGGEFILQMGVGAAVGVCGGYALRWFTRAVPLPSEALYPLRMLACIFVIFGIGTFAHGSGFLSVFVAGILTGDSSAPYKREVERFHSALASFGEIVAFVVLGLTVDLGQLTHLDVWLPGLVLAAVLAGVLRPVLVGLCLLPARLAANERNFVLFAGLKGAVPILLGVLIREAHVPQAERLFGIVVVVVVFSVLLQGTFVPAVASALKLRVETVEPEPWALGVRLRDEPDGVHRLRVQRGSRADGATIDDIGELVDDVWVSIVVRDRHLVAVSGETELLAGDEIVVLGAGDRRRALRDFFDAVDGPSDG